MILVVLALIWVVALTPTILRKLAEREGTYSVARFHRGLRAMRRAFPHQVAVAGAGSAGSAGVSLLGGQHAARAIGAHTAGRSRPAVSGGEVRTRTAGGSSAAQRTSGPSARRRRQVLASLGGGLMFSFLLGLLPHLGVLWYLSLVLLLLTGGYVALLVHFRRLADERAEKVVFLDPPAASGPVTAPIPRIQPYLPGQAAPAFRTASSVRIAAAAQGRRVQPAVVGG